MTDDLTHPSASEFEFSLFGPGRGECVVLHLGGDEWTVVDSCTQPGRADSVALDYLGRLGVNSNRIRLVFATHWHDDHTKGLASVMRAATAARIGMSTAFRVTEFTNLVAAADVHRNASGASEFAKIVEILDQRRTARLGNLGEFLWAWPGRVLLDLPGESHPFPVTIRSLNPSDSSLRAAMEEVSAALPRPSGPTRVVPHRSPNRASVVLAITAGGTRLLLGADLEHSSQVNDGWLAIVGDHDGLNALALKVPHHGSANADSPEMWTTMLVQDVVAAVAPYSSGVTPRPSPGDLRRLTSRTRHVYCTAKPEGRTPPRRDPLVERQLRQIAKSRRVVSSECGHIRVRWLPLSPTSPPQIDLFAGAFHVRPASSEPRFIL